MLVRSASPWTHEVGGAALMVGVACWWEGAEGQWCVLEGCRA